MTLDSFFYKDPLRCVHFTSVFASLKTFKMSQFFDWYNSVCKLQNQRQKWCSSSQTKTSEILKSYPHFKIGSHSCYVCLCFTLTILFKRTRRRRLYYLCKPCFNKKQQCLTRDIELNIKYKRDLDTFGSDSIFVKNVFTWGKSSAVMV